MGCLLFFFLAQDESGKLTNDYWSKLQSRLKIDDDEEEAENDENKAEKDKEDEELAKKFETSLANKEIEAEEQSL